jgi:hypothetical protein
LVGKTLNGVAKHPEVQVDDEGIKVLYNVFDDTVSEDLFVPFLKEFLKPILTQSLFTSNGVEICLQVRILTV